MSNRKQVYKCKSTETLNLSDMKNLSKFNIPKKVQKLEDIDMKNIIGGNNYNNYGNCALIQPGFCFGPCYSSSGTTSGHCTPGVLSNGKSGCVCTANL